MVGKENFLNTCLSVSTDIVDRGLKKRVPLFITFATLNGFLGSFCTGCTSQFMFATRLKRVHRYIFCVSVSLYLTVVKTV